MGKCRYDLLKDCHGRDCLACVLDKIIVDINEQIGYNECFNSDMSKGQIIAFEWVKRKINKYREGLEE